MNGSVQITILDPDPRLVNWPYPPENDYPDWLVQKIWATPYGKEEWRMIGCVCFQRRRMPVGNT